MTSETVIARKQGALARRRSPSLAFSGTGPRYLLTAVCAASAGVHAGIVPEHLTEAGPRLATVFAGTAALLLLAAAWTSRPRYDAWAPAAAAALLSAIAVAYLLSRTAGLPGLIGDPEAVDPIGLVTSVGELLGAFAGIVLYVNRKEPA
jgi:hypothetical protein